MRRFILLFFLMFMPISVFASELESAMKNSEHVLLYLYTQRCKYCVEFNPIYQKIKNIYGDKCNFVKINASEAEGAQLMQSFEARFVPYVILINSKEKNFIRLNPTCLLEYSCVESNINKFIR